MLQDEPHQQPQRSVQSPSPRRRLKVNREVDEATQQKYMISYLGGLYPPVDKGMMPLYLRDVDYNDIGDEHILDMYNPDFEGESTMKNSDLVFFWHIPKASGSTMKHIMNICFGLKRAEKTEKKASMTFSRPHILNMDTSSPEGLSFAFANQLVNSNTVDVIVSNYFLSGSALFTDKHMGKTFTIFRHPTEIASSLFHYRKKAMWERSFRDDWKHITFHSYVIGEHYMDNWSVRQLTGTMPWVELNESHLERAKSIVKRKIFVGILSEMDETMRQFKAHFKWEDKTPNCSNEQLHSNAANKNDHPEMQGGRGGMTWNVLAEKDKWDFSLYHYALELFAMQRERYPP